jgi:hypothetical protein
MQSAIGTISGSFMLDDHMASDRTVEILSGSGGDPVKNVLTHGFADIKVLAGDAQTHGSPHPSG